MDFLRLVNCCKVRAPASTAQKMKFSIKDLISKCYQICSLRIWSHLLKKSFMENFIFSAVLKTVFSVLLKKCECIWKTSVGIVVMVYFVRLKKCGLISHEVVLVSVLCLVPSYMQLCWSSIYIFPWVGFSIKAEVACLLLVLGDKNLSFGYSRFYHTENMMLL